MATLEELGGPKESGDLILSDDWMAVVNEVVRLGTEVERLDAEKADRTTVEALQTRVETLASDLEGLAGRVDGVDERVGDIEEILEGYGQLGLSTPSLRHAVGAQAEITAVVRDLRGDRVEFASGEPRPWVDFVGTWGRLVPAPGFESASRGGAGRRSLAVQVNRDGEARVLLRAESAAGVAEDDEVRMVQTMQAQVAGGSRTVEAVILESQTPVEAGEQGAWNHIRAEYDASQEGSVRRYLDTLYLYGRARPVEFERSRWGQSFQDHRSTVMAFLKPDGDPRTPDHGQAVSSIQITFRDWFWPWVDVGYLPRRELVEVDMRDDVRVLLEELPPIHEVAPRIQELFGTWLDDRGFVERERNIGVLIEALDDATLPAGRPEAEILFGRSKEALELQRQLDRGGTVGGGKVTGGHMAAFLGMAGRTEAEVGAVKEQVAAATEETREVRGEVEDFERRVQFLGGQVEEAVAEGGRLAVTMQSVDNLRAEVDDIRATVTGPTDAMVRNVQEQVQEAFERIVLLER